MISKTNAPIAINKIKEDIHRKIGVPSTTTYHPTHEDGPMASVAFDIQGQPIDLAAMYSKWITVARLALYHLHRSGRSPKTIWVQSNIQDNSGDLTIIFTREALAQIEHDDVISRCRAMMRDAGTSEFYDVEV